MKKLALIASMVVVLLGTALSVRLADDSTPTTQPPSADGPPNAPNAPDSQARIDGTVSMDAALSRRWMRRTSPEPLQAAFDVQASGRAHRSQRPPLRVAVVLDRSGSMQGDKMEHARRAAHDVVNRLTARDSLAVVSYATDASVDTRPMAVGGSGVRRSHEAIDAIRPGGGTNVAAGLEVASDLLDRRSARGEGVDRIIMLSDGHPTLGVTESTQLGGIARRIRQNGTTVTTMGVGLDYNEDVMTAVANQGAGNYHFVDSPGQATEVFRAELDALSETVAREAELSLRLADGIKLKSVKGFPHRREDGRVVVSLSEFAAGQLKSAVLALEPLGTPAQRRPILEATLSYVDLGADRRTRRSVDLEVGVTDQAERVARHTDPEVVARVEQLEVAETLQQAMEAWKSGRSTEAADALRRQRRDLRRARRKYELDDSRFQEVERELDDVAEMVQRRGSGTDEGRRAIKANKERGNAILKDRSAF